jgi:nitroreductase
VTGVEHEDVVRARRMVRAYDPARPVDDAVLTRLLEHATRAPSAGFSQGWDFVVLRGEARTRFWDVTTDEEPDSWVRGMRTAPVLLLCLSDPERYVRRYAEPDKSGAAAAPGSQGRAVDDAAWPVPYWDVDTGMAALLVLLGAVDAGLGGCFFGVPDHRHDAVREAFAIPSGRRLVGVVSLGHPAPDRPSPSLRRGRRGVGEVAHEGRFGIPFVPVDGPDELDGREGPGD